MEEDRDMTYGEFVGLVEKLVGMEVLSYDDVFMWFIQKPGADFACPFFYALGADRFMQVLREGMKELPEEKIKEVADACSVKTVIEHIMGKGADALIGLLDFKDAEKSDEDKFGGMVTIAGAIYNQLCGKGLVGKIDSKEEATSAVFGFRVYGGKWIPVLAKLPEGRTARIPDEVQAKFTKYMLGAATDLESGQVKRVPIASVEPDVLEWIEILRDFHLYDGQNAISGG